LTNECVSSFPTSVDKIRRLTVLITQIEINRRLIVFSIVLIILRTDQLDFGAKESFTSRTSSSLEKERKKGLT
jgi:hypothetical protein